MFQHAASYNGYLTELCQAAHADEADSIGNKLFPAVGVRTAVGTYKKRDIGNAFRVYRTALARGNSRPGSTPTPRTDSTTAAPMRWKSGRGNLTPTRTTEARKNAKAIFRN